MDELKLDKLNWLIFANTEAAEIYEVVKKNYTLLKTLTHPQSRLKAIDLVTDESGHYKTSHTARGQFFPPNDPHEQVHQEFAIEISDFLKKAQQDNQYETITLCAEPHFYGVLKKSLPESVLSSVVKTIQKDYVPLSDVKKKDMLETIVNQKFL